MNKFRALDKEYGGYDETHHIMLTHNGDAYHEEYDEVMNERFEIQLSTGRTDMNDIEIFVGDTIQFKEVDAWDDDLTEKGIVAYNGSYFYLKDENDDYIRLWNDGSIETYNLDVLNLEEYSEVI